MPPRSKPIPEPILPSSASLHEIHNTLHLLYHRNKNQHRCAKWFKQLSILRRDTRKLAFEVEEVERLKEEFDERVDEVRDKARKMVEFLGREVVGRCYWAFSTVVADTQFSALGVVLIALLARLSKVIGAERYLLGKDPEDMSPTEKMVKSTDITTPREDLGEVITRDQIPLNVSMKSTPVASRSDPEPRRKGKKRSAPAEKEEEIKILEVNASREDKVTLRSAKSRITSSTVPSEKRNGTDDKKRKKKKRKGNAIDDIFGGL